MLHVFFHAIFPFPRCVSPFQFDYVLRFSLNVLLVSQAFYLSSKNEVGLKHIPVCLIFF